MQMPRESPFLERLAELIRYRGANSGKRFVGDMRGILPNSRARATPGLAPDPIPEFLLSISRASNSVSKF